MGVWGRGGRGRGGHTPTTATFLNGADMAGFLGGGDCVARMLLNFLIIGNFE